MTGTIFFGDYYSGDAGISLTGTVAACIKATQGTDYKNPAYASLRDEANRVGAYVFAYHFLTRGNAKAQAKFYYENHGNRPVMVDAEIDPATGHGPSLADILEFADTINGEPDGSCHLVYLPKSYWEQIGSPDLRVFRDSGPLRLVSSNYTTYSDNGVGWEPYGGMFPQIWQYTDSFNMHGRIVDFNAFKGSVKDLAAMAEHGTLPGK